MAVIRINKNQNYTVMSNYHFREKNMSLKAKGLLSLMLSLPDDWDYSIAGLVAICKENETAIKNTLKELREFGYLQITKLMPDKDKNRSRIEYVYDIFEQPQEDKKQEVENLPLENLPVENQGQLNTKESSTKKLNTKNNNKKNNKKDNSIIDEVIDYLNEKGGTNFKPKTKKTQTLITSLLDNGYTIDDFKTVIDKQVYNWKDTEWEKYLRPATLFQETKFENYLNAPIKKPSYDREAYQNSSPFANEQDTWGTTI